MDDRLPQGGLDQAFASAATKAHYVRRLFTTIAGRYDLITRLLSCGADRRWKRRLIRLSGITPGQHVLDLACGTGDLACLAADTGAAAVGLDIVPKMIALAREKPSAAAIRWVVGDMAALPVAAGHFDVVTTGYGLRNVADLPAALREIHRVLKPRGLLAALDFNRPESAAVRSVYLGYLTVVGSILGYLLHGNPDTYRYIPASIRRYPGARRVAALLRELGFDDVRAIPVLGGLMAIHLARKR